MNILLFLKKYQILKFIFSLKSFIFLISFILSVPVLSIPTGTKTIHYYFGNSFSSSSEPDNRPQKRNVKKYAQVLMCWMKRFVRAFVLKHRMIV